MSLTLDVETSVLRCPACGEEPAFHPVGDGAAVARCACAEYPLAEGVLVTNPGGVQDHLLEAVRRGDARAARSVLLGNHRRKARLIEGLGMRLTFQRYVRHRALSEVVNHLKLRPALERMAPRAVFARVAAAAQWNIYIRHRFAQPPMMSVVALLGLVQGRDGLVLDAPCGMGHLSFLLGKLVPQRRIVCMDLSAPFVFATRRFFAPDVGAAVVHNMNNPLPLADESFGAIFCSDSFHYVENRRGLAREFMRVLRDDGVLVISHAHNRLHRTAYAGYPLAPAEYASLFEGHPVRVVPEPVMVDAYLGGAPLDLSRTYDDEELNRAPYLHVIAAKSPEALAGTVPPVRGQLLDAASNPRVSGLYHMTRRGATVVFERRIPEGLESEYAPFGDILPPRVTVPASSVHGKNGDLRFDNERELLERHVLIDVPEDF
jgi:SAM-dependent methyltransferase